MIRLSHIEKSYCLGSEAVQALSDISLHVRPGEFVSIVGPSGSGKSTLMNILGLLDIPDSGAYYLDGQGSAPCRTTDWQHCATRRSALFFKISIF